MTEESEPGCLSDEELVQALDGLAKKGRRCLRQLLRHLAVFDERRLAMKEGAPSTFQYCVTRLAFSEGEAYRRIHSARVAAKWPMILELIEQGRLNLTSVTLLAAHLSEENHRDLLNEACGKTKFEIQRMVAAIDPKPDGPDVIRRIADPHPAPQGDLFGAGAPPPAGALAGPLETPRRREQSIVPAAPERIRFSFTGGERLLALLRRAQEVLRHKYPAGDLALVLQDALDVLLERRDPERRLKAKEQRRKEYGRPQPEAPEDWSGRRVPQAVKDAVWRRDGGQCVYREPDGERCPERGGLEFDHVVPFALGGPSNNPKNIRLLCKAHNRALAARAFGDFSARRWPGPRDRPAS